MEGRHASTAWVVVATTNAAATRMAMSEIVNRVVITGTEEGAP
jgi:hypothetical protein